MSDYGFSVDYETIQDPYDIYMKSYRERAFERGMKKMTTEKGMRITDQMVEGNLYYVGSNTIFSRKNGEGWGDASLDKVTEKARSIAESSGDDVFIVKIVRVIRHPRSPLEVKDTNF